MDVLPEFHSGMETFGKHKKPKLKKFKYPVDNEIIISALPQQSYSFNTSPLQKWRVHEIGFLLLSVYEEQRATKRHCGAGEINTGSSPQQTARLVFSMAHSSNDRPREESPEMDLMHMEMC